MQDSKTTPQISIIIPCYNVENYIDRCMNSLVNQTIGVENLEIILVNDASTDNTYEHLRNWEKQYPESIIVINLDQNGKQGTARNIGMQYASCDFIGFVDSDDWIELDMYELMLQKMQESDYDLVQCKLVQSYQEEYLSEKDKKVSDDFEIIIRNARERSDLIAAGCISGYPVTKLYRTLILRENNIFFLENMAYEDMFFLGILNLYVSRIGFIGKRLYHYFYNPESTSRQKNEQRHYDLFKVGRLQWEEYEKRGLLGKYLAAFQYEFLQRCYVMGMIRLIQNMEIIPYGPFLKIQKMVKEKVPDYVSNPYMKPTEAEKILLELLDKELPEEVWINIERMLHKIWR